MKKSTLLVVALLGALSLTAAENNFESSLDELHRDLYHEFAKVHRNQNFVFSPLAVQMALGILRSCMADESESAKELDIRARFRPRTVQQINSDFNRFLSQSIGDESLKIINKLYVNDKSSNEPYYELTPSADFVKFVASTSDMNRWLKSQVANLDGQLNAVIFNSIIYNAAWTSPFQKRNTEKNKFYLHDNGHVLTNIMQHDLTTFEYADLGCLGLNAEAVKLEYSGSDISMLIILPKTYDGLPQLEHKLQFTTIADIKNALEHRPILVNLPKFSIKIEEDMIPILKSLSIQRIFEDAQLTHLRQGAGKVWIEKFIHNTAIHVDEDGTIANSTHVGIAPGEDEILSFNAIHPFYFAITNSEDAVMFAGHVVNPLL
ncbi:neuroserpin-like [Drosophila busckii]|uniref:neuroserpin-like n=1 Tax=Drosophila busckii TaxID=30019 RepID=UPI0014329C64|nr:neuroserpin-like [Drosophila busckii]